MTAMERIKELEKIGTHGLYHLYGTTTEEYDCGQCGYNGVFLLRAFKVMREIAASKVCKHEHPCKTGTIGHCFRYVDAEFEKRMQGETK